MEIRIANTRSSVNGGFFSKLINFREIIFNFFKKQKQENIYTHSFIIYGETKTHYLCYEILNLNGANKKTKYEKKWFDKQIIKKNIKIYKEFNVKITEKQFKDFTNKFDNVPYDVFNILDFGCQMVGNILKYIRGYIGNSVNNNKILQKIINHKFKVDVFKNDDSKVFCSELAVEILKINKNKKTKKFYNFMKRNKNISSWVELSNRTTPQDFERFSLYLREK